MARIDGEAENLFLDIGFWPMVLEGRFSMAHPYSCQVRMLLMSSVLYLDSLFSGRKT